MHAGSWAELIVLPEDNFVAAKPDRVDAAAAGTAPVAALNAIAAFDALAPIPGEDVLVVGATGGVGSFFLQLAASVGANVIAPALPENESYLRDLEVIEVLDRNADLAAAVREAYPDGLNALFDVVSQAPDASLLKEGGRLASPLGAAGEGDGRFNVMAASSPANLQRLGELLAAAHCVSLSSGATHSSRLGRPSRRSRDPHPGQARHHDHLTRRRREKARLAISIRRSDRLGKEGSSTRSRSRTTSACDTTSSP